MQRKTLTLILFMVISLALTSFANSKFVPGYIIRPNGDTIQGYLKMQNSFNASLTCIFKTDPSKPAITYTPADLKGYRYSNGKLYLAKVLPDAPEQNTRVFMECLVDGMLTFYYYKDKENDRYFAEKKDVGLNELTNAEKEATDPNTFKHIYLAKLSICTSDCTELKPVVDKTVLSHKSLIDLSKAYQELVCPANNCIIYEREKPSPEFRFALVMGASCNKYNFGNRLVSNYSPGIQLGMGFQIHNILFSSEMAYLDFKLLVERDFAYTLSNKPGYSTNYPVTYNAVDYLINSHNSFGTIPNLKADLNVLGLKIPVMVNFKFPVKKTTLYLGLGIADKIILSYNKDYIDYYFNEQYGKTFNTFLLGGIVNLGFDLQLKPGNAIGISLYGEYMVVPGAVNSMLRLRESQLALQLIYHFKKI